MKATLSLLYVVWKALDRRNKYGCMNTWTTLSLAKVSDCEN
jgi:hypothetical protein